MSRRSYYYKAVVKSREEINRQEEVLQEIHRIAEEYPRYGYRRITHQLRRCGLTTNHKKVIRIMRENRLLCEGKRRFIITTNSKHGYPIYPNLIKGMEVSRLNQVWAADITYVGIRRGFVYLAAILDGFSRKGIGWAVSGRIDTKLTLGALRMAINSRGVMTGIIHHSDQGVQYASDDYVKELTEHKFQISMSRKGNPYDNAMMESFMKTLKYEEVYLWDYETLEDVQKLIPYFIEEVYNKKRLHSSLGYRPPDEYEELILSGKTKVAYV
jgi:transposase InsO family protein